MSAYTQTCPRLAFRLPFLAAFAGIPVLILITVAAPVHPQEVDVEWHGTVEVDLPEQFIVAPGKTFVYRIRLSEEPDGDGWWIRLHVDGEVRSDGDYKGITWVPSVGWEFDRTDWDQWRTITVYAKDGAEVDTQYRFTHEVWDHNTDCPVHGAGPFQVAVIEDNGNRDNHDIDGNSDIGGNGDGGNGGGDGGDGGDGSNGSDGSNGGNGGDGSGGGNGSDGSNGGGSGLTPGLPYLSINNVTVNEGVGNAVFTLVLSKESETQVAVAYATADVSATAGEDYAAAKGEIAFQPGMTRKNISITVHDDSEAEGHETFSVRLSNPRNATLSDSSGTATISDDEYDGVRVSYGAASYTVAEGASVSVEVVLSAAPHDPVTIALVQVPGLGAGPDDYSGVPASVRFATTETTKLFKFLAARDEEDDDGELVTLGFGSLPAGVIAGSPAQSSVTIADTPARARARVPAGWLRQFGRTAVSDAVDAIDERMRCARDRRPDTGGDDDSQWRCAQNPGPAAFAIDGRVAARLAAAANATGATVVHAEPHRLAAAGPAVVVSNGSTLLASSTKPKIRPGMSVWGRGTYSRFDGGVALATSADVWTATLGTDFAFRQAVAGIALAHSESEGTASQNGVETGVTAVLTGLYPYLRVGLNDRLSVWGTIGAGTGTLAHSLHGAPSLKTGIAMTMAAAGGLAEIVAAEHGGLSLAIKADGLLLAIKADRTTALPSALVDASRLRLVLESAYEFVLQDRQRVAPFVEIGGRFDGADTAAESGLGFEVGGGIRYAHPMHHLTAEIHSRALLVHASDGFKSWSASGTLRYDPRSGSAQGPYLTMTSSRGLAGIGGHAASPLARVTDAAALAAGDAGWGVETEFGYGMPIPGVAATGTPWAGLSLLFGKPEYRLGYRLEYNTGLHLSLAAALREGDQSDRSVSYLITLLLSLR